MPADETPPGSDYTIAYEDRGQYLCARISGAYDSVAASLAYWRDVAAEARSRGFRRVLIVEGFQTPLSLLDVYHVSEQIPALIRGLVVAFVDLRSEQFDDNKFGEDVAVNRGALGKVFATEEEAVEWLLAQ